MTKLMVVGFVAMFGFMGVATIGAYFVEARKSDVTDILVFVSGCLLVDTFSARAKLARTIRVRDRLVASIGMPVLVILICSLTSLLIWKISGASFSVFLSAGIIAFTMAPVYEMGERLRELGRQGQTDSVPLHKFGRDA
jgi:hypothetical protein